MKHVIITCLVMYVLIMISITFHSNYILNSISNCRMELQQLRKEIFILHKDQLKDPEIYKKIEKSFEENKIK